MPDDELGPLLDRPGWTAAGNAAVYKPVPGGWSSRVAMLIHPTRARDRFHIAVIDPAGHARFTMYASMISEAWRLAEGHVRGKQGQ